MTSSIPRAEIRDILVSDWDPSNVSRSEHARGEYDGYIEPLYQLIAGGADEDAIIAFLREREQETMCFPGLDSRRLKPVAQKLLHLIRPSDARPGDDRP